MGEIRKYHGHKTMLDGSHEPLTQAEAEGLWKSIEEAKARRVESMPTVADALRTMLDAKQRMQELGWWQGGGLRVRPGDKCAIAEFGSTGIWSGWVDDEGKYVHYGDIVSNPRKCWLKPLADLTPEEQAHMAKCDEHERIAHETAMRRSLALPAPSLPKEMKD